MDDHVQLKSHVRIFHKKRLIYEGKNLVVNGGLGLIATLLGGSGTAPTHMAMGTTATAPTATNTALLAETHRPAASHSVVQNAITFTATFTSLNSGTENPREFGLLNGSSGGTLFCRFICPLFDWLAGDALVVTWTINIGELG